MPELEVREPVPEFEETIARRFGLDPHDPTVTAAAKLIAVDAVLVDELMDGVKRWTQPDLRDATSSPSGRRARLRRDLGVSARSVA